MPRFALALALIVAISGPVYSQEPTAPTAAEPEVESEGAAAAGADAEVADDGFATARERASYAVGLSFGRAMQFRQTDLDAEQTIAGLRDALSGGEARMSDQDAEVLTRMVQNRAFQRLQAQAEARRTEGRAFLAENKLRPEVVETESGLQYEVVRAAEGPKPTLDDTVTLHFRGMLIDGSEIDSTHERGPAGLAVRGSLPAWEEALPMMSVGAIWKLYIAPELGFEALGIGGRNTPAGATLVYEIELLSIEPGPAAGETPEDGGSR